MSEAEAWRVPTSRQLEEAARKRKNVRRKERC